MEKPRWVSRWDSINPAYSPYFRDLRIDGRLGMNECDYAYGYLRQPEKILPEMQTVLEQLSLYTVTPETATNHRIREAWGLLSEFAQRHERFLKKNALSLFVYGSMIYDDPRNLDYDIEFFGEYDDRNLSMHILLNWGEELDMFWGKVGSPAGNIIYRSFEEIDTCYKVTVKKDQEAFENIHPVRIAESFECAAALFSGYPLYVPRQDYVEEKQKVIMSYAQNNPLLAFHMLDVLQDALSIRRERRGEK